MSTMVERVAEAISTAVWVRGPDLDKDVCLSAARAVLVAMREPTAFMLDSIEGMHDDHHYANPSRTWPAMIDAALSEGLPTSDKPDHISRP